MRFIAIQIVVGTAFGYVLARSGSSDFGAIRQMFLFEDFMLFKVALLSTALTSLGLWLLKRSRGTALLGNPIKWSARPMHCGSVPGAAIFGIGWGISGLCPGTIPAFHPQVS